MQAVDLVLIPQLCRDGRDALVALAEVGNAVREPRHLGWGVRVELVDETLSAAIWRACTRPGLRGREEPELISSPRIAYAFVLDSSADWNEVRREDRWPGQVHPLQRVLSLSRLVRVHGFGLDIAANVVHEGTELRWVRPLFAPTAVASRGLTPKLLDDERGWLDIAELRALAPICREIEAAGWDNVPHRLRRAAVMHENACHTDDMRVRALLMATAWESLATIGLFGMTKQFINRSSAIARWANFAGYDEELAEEAWETRCGFAHGALVPTFKKRTFRDNRAILDHAERVSTEMERALRVVLQHALTSSGEWPRFNTDAALEAAFPI